MTQKDEAKNRYDSRKEKVVARKKVDLKTSIHELQMRPFSSVRIPILFYWFRTNILQVVKPNFFEW